MTCATCGFEAAADFAFCPKCGTKLAAVPASDVTVRPAHAPSPGVSSLPDAQSDRRPVTVLFSDLSGFTTLSERLDPEDVRALQGDLFKEMSTAIERFEGFVEKFVGDAVMGVFGAPIAHEDDPERALHAALLMRDRVAVLSERWVRRIGSPLALHIGVNTGPVVAGQIGSGPGAAYAVTGDTVNTAARLQSSAKPGQILASQSTYLLAQHAFDFEKLGDISLKGKAEPVAVYGVLVAIPTPRPTRGLQASAAEAPFVGRDHELNDLVAAFERMLEGQTQVVTLVGEAGAGKTRLLAEFESRLTAEGHLETTAVRRALCSSVGERTYGVPAALLRDAYGVMSQDSPTVARKKFVAGVQAMGADQAEIERLAALLGYLLGFETEDPRMRQIDPKQLERQIFLAAQDVIEHRLQHSALVLVVEDLHWADAASVALLQFLIDRLQDRRFMLIVSHRAGHDVEGLALGGAGQTVVRLQPLSAGDGGALLGALLRAAAPALAPDLRLRILEHAGGNPLFIEEIVRALAGGALVQEEGQWVYRADAAAVHVPLTIHGLLLARIDRLPGSARQHLQEASVLGPVFAESLLREVTDDRGALDHSLSFLVDAELLVDASRATVDSAAGSAEERRYRFRHGLFHEAAYKNLLVSRRTELHTRIGQALERLCGPEPRRLEDLEALGHHFRLSADKPRGAHYLVTAGDWAAAIHANTDAIRHYERALEILEACGGLDAQQLAVHERLGDLLGPAGKRADALRHFSAGRDGFARAVDHPGEARVLRKIGALHWDAGDRGEAARCFQQGLALTEADPDNIERAHLYREMGQLAFRSGDNDRAVQWAERSLAHAEGHAARVSSGDERRAAAAAISLALNTLGVALARLNRPVDAVAHLLRSVSIAREAELLQIECKAVANLGILYSTLDPARAIETCERGLETAKRIGDLGLQSRLYTNLAVAYCALTNRCDEDGIGAAHTAIELDRRMGQLDHLAVPLVVLGQIYQCHGEPARAMGYYREAMVLAENVDEPQLLFPCYDGLATLFLDSGDETQAEYYMRKAQEVCERAGVEPDALTVLPFLG
jgi:adenylate cyclase